MLISCDVSNTADTADTTDTTTAMHRLLETSFQVAKMDRYIDKKTGKASKGSFKGQLQKKGINTTIDTTINTITTRSGGKKRKWV